MGVELGPQGQGGRRSVDAELNLIPFIDLLSVCILFLLMTAVWVEISKMSAFTQASGETIVQNSDSQSLVQGPEGRDWDVLVTPRGVEILARGQRIAQFQPEAAADQIEQLSRSLNVETARVSLRAEDAVVYENLVSVLDALVSAKFRNISIGGM